MGGDGTISEVADGILSAGAGARTELGIIPRGTGGDFRRTLELPHDITEAGRRIRDGAARVVDVGRVSYRGADGQTETRHFVNVASFGFSSAVARRANQSSKRFGGKIAFLERHRRHAGLVRQHRRLDHRRRRRATAAARHAGGRRQRAVLRRRHEDLPGGGPGRRPAGSGDRGRSFADRSAGEHRPPLRRNAPRAGRSRQRARHARDHRARRGRCADPRRAGRRNARPPAGDVRDPSRARCAYVYENEANICFGGGAAGRRRVQRQGDPTRHGRKGRRPPRSW